MLMKNKSIQHKRFLITTILIVIALGVMDIVSFLTEPVHHEDKVSVVLGRGPANVVDEVVTELPKRVTADFNCAQDYQNIEVDGSRIRLKSNSCENFRTSDLTITNKSNGYTASIFQMKNNEFTTDFIDLKYGENQVEVKMKDAAGYEKTHSLTVHRRAPASASK